MKNYLAQIALATAAVCAAVLPTAASAIPITKTVTLNVYQVCNTSGGNCASTGPAGDTYFAAATNKIWAQAGISVVFSYMGQILNSLFSNINDTVAGSTFSDLASSTGHLQSSSVLDMFLVNTVVDGSGSSVYGEGWLGSGGLVMAMDTIMGYAAGGRIDTMAHELGHNLGLVAANDPSFSNYHSTDADELMASGGTRHVPLTLADINPSGFGYDQISDFQASVARSSSLLSDVVPSNNVPEPGSLALVAIALLGLGAARRRAAPTAHAR
jgi:hypothetical protein